MSMATGVVLFVIGAILAFAVSIDVPGVDLSMIGSILMAAGVVVFVIGLVMTLRGRTSVSRASTTADGSTVVRERTTDDAHL